jgi:pimeloyl-ACP methyl ester carboxylesterase
MTTSYAEELILATMEDGVLLGGAFIQPAGPETEPVGLLWVHGGGGHFYDAPLVLAARELARDGYTSLTGNTRGHDLAALLPRADGEVVVGGGAWEDFGETARDLKVWIDILAARGFERVALVGHSLGGSKVVQYQAERQDPRVAGIVAASAVGRWPKNAERVKLGEEMVAEGRGEKLLPAREGAPVWNLLSARTVASRERYIVPAFHVENGEPLVSTIRCPVLAFFGSLEEDATEELAGIRESASRAVDVTTALVEGTGHDYADHEPEVARIIARWLRGVVADS